MQIDADSCTKMSPECLTLFDKYDADVAASNKRKQSDVHVDFEKLAQAAGSVSAKGGFDYERETEQA